MTRYAILVAGVLIGCGPEEDPAAHAQRQVSDPLVDMSPGLQRFLGTWLHEDREVLRVVRQGRDAVMIVADEMDGWDPVVNNVRLEGKSLVYDFYCYFSPKESSHPQVRDLRTHPFSGVRCEMELIAGDKPDELVSFGDAFGLSGRPTKLTRKQ